MHGTQSSSPSAPYSGIRILELEEGVVLVEHQDTSILCKDQSIHLGDLRGFSLGSAFPPPHELEALNV